MKKTKQTPSNAASFSDALETFNAGAKTRQALSAQDRTELQEICKLATAYADELNEESYRQTSIASADASRVKNGMVEYDTLAEGTESRAIGTATVAVPAIESATIRNALHEKGCRLLDLVAEAENARRANAERRAGLARAEEGYLVQASANAHFGPIIGALSEVLEINSKILSDAFVITEGHLVLALDLMGQQFQTEVGYRLNVGSVLAALRRRLQEKKQAAA